MVMDKNQMAFSSLSCGLRRVALARAIRAMAPSSLLPPLALGGPSGPPRGPAGAAQGAMEAGAVALALASLSSPTLAPPAQGASPASQMVCGLWLSGERGVSTMRGPVQANACGARRAPCEA